MYWDGLFSQNLPVRDLLNDLPDEAWVIQIDGTAALMIRGGRIVRSSPALARAQQVPLNS